MAQEPRLTLSIAHAAASRLASGRPEAKFRDGYPAYVRDIDDNLIPGVTRSDFADDLLGGDGIEFAEIGGQPPRFSAAHSSAAIAVNTFAPFRRSPESLSFAGHSGFTLARFGKRLNTGLTGSPPSLAFYAAGPSGIVAVEGVFTEPLVQKFASFTLDYDRAMADIDDPPWNAMYSSLQREPKRFRKLDAAQLVMHYLGLHYSLQDEPAPKTLVYLYWEPTNAEDVEEFRDHRYEVLTFSVAVSGSAVPFVSMSYPELWERWEDEASWSGAAEHVARLRERYLFAL
jgi:hypothetical protein